MDRSKTLFAGAKWTQLHRTAHLCIRRNVKIERQTPITEPPSWIDPRSHFPTRKSPAFTAQPISAAHRSAMASSSCSWPEGILDRSKIASTGLLESPERTYNGSVIMPSRFLDRSKKSLASAKCAQLNSTASLYRPPMNKTERHAPWSKMNLGSIQHRQRLSVVAAIFTRFSGEPGSWIDPRSVTLNADGATAICSLARRSATSWIDPRLHRTLSPKEQDLHTRARLHGPRFLDRSKTAGFEVVTYKMAKRLYLHKNCASNRNKCHVIGIGC